MSVLRLAGPVMLFYTIVLSRNILFSQQNIAFQHDVYITYDSILNKPGYDFHTAFKPYFVQPALPFNPDSLNLSNRTKPLPAGWIYRKMRYQNLIEVDTQDFRLSINPMVELSTSYIEGKSDTYYQNTRGFRITGTIEQKLAFESSFYENQARFLPFITDFVKENQIAPGQGLVKDFKTNGYDYAYATGIISYSPSRYFNFQFGHGKNFIGDGYRSLLLSDISFNYPFFKITTNIWRIQYTNLFATLTDTRAPHTYESGFQKKHATFHFLSINVHKRVQIGLFEAIIWQDADSTGQRGYDLNYFNPVIFYRPVEFSLHSPDNALVGGTLKLKISNSLHIYGQLIIDDFDLAGMKKGKGYILNKTGYQAGMKYYHVLGIENLVLQGEYNSVRPYVYAHKTPLQNYSHYNQPLAHPIGSNFNEILGRIEYRLGDFIARYRINYLQYGADTNGSHWGHDIFISDYKAQRGFPSYGNSMLQGLKTSVVYQQIEAAYLLNPNYNLCFVIQYTSRVSKNQLGVKDINYFTIGISTSLQNLYYDF